MLSARKGFTLIELMVAISIIAIISAIGFVSYSQAQVTARDAKRKQDLRSIQTALTLYYQINKTYPIAGTAPCCAGALLSSSASDPWLTNLNTSYINKMPRDPRADTASFNPFTTSTAGTGYGYWAGPTTEINCPTNNTLGGQYFALAASLENTSDPDRNGVAGSRKYSYCDSSQDLFTNASAYIVTSQ